MKMNSLTVLMLSLAIGSNQLAMAQTSANSSDQGIQQDQGGGWKDDWSGRLTLEPILGGSENWSTGLTGQLKFQHTLEEANQDLVFEPKARLNLNDPNRNLVDIQQLAWSQYWQKWRLHVGWQLVSYQRTEVSHLIDQLYNQSDLAGNIDGEDKLGQPMVRVAYTSENFGTLELSVMPYTPKRTFGGEFPITDSAEFEAGQWNVSTALRWSNTFDRLEIGLTQFFGTSREPELVPKLVGTKVEFDPFYPQVNQTGLDWQLRLPADILYKGEALAVTGGNQSYFAATHGLEYTFWDVKGSGLDLSLITEHLYDSRHDPIAQPFDNDIFIGGRVGRFDWEILFGPVIDLNSGETFLNLEYEHQLTPKGNFTLDLEARGAFNSQAEGALEKFKKYFKAGFTVHF